MTPSWPYSTFGEIYKMSTGNSINEDVKRKKYLNATNGLPYYSTADIAISRQISPIAEVRIIESDAKNYKVAESGTVLLCIEGGSAGRKVAQAQEACHYGNKLVAIYSNDSIRNKLAFYYIQSREFIENFNREQSGLIGGVSLNKMKELPIPNPPRGELVSILTNLERALKDLERLEDNIARSKSDLNSYWQACIDENTLSEHGQAKLISDVFTVARGGSPRPIKDYITDSPDGVPWIKIGDTVLGGRYIESTLQRISPNGVPRSRLIKPNDLLLTNSMSFGRPYVSKIAGCIHDGWLVFSPKDDTVFTDFFYYLFSSSIMKNTFDKAAQGSTVRNLNRDLVASMEIIFPSIVEQKQAVSKLDRIRFELDKLGANLTQRKEELDLLRAQIITAAFSGDMK